MSLTTRSGLRLVRDWMRRGLGCGCGCGSGQPAWFAVWLFVSALLVLSVPHRFEKTIRLTRGSIQRTDPEGVRQGIEADATPEAGATTVPTGDRIHPVPARSGSGTVGTAAIALPVGAIPAAVEERSLLSLRPSSRRRSGPRPFLTPPTHAPPVPTVS